MRYLVIISFILAGSPGIASAQVGAKTVCGWELGKWVCQTKAPTQYVQPYSGSPMQQAFEASQQRYNQQAREREVVLNAEAVRIRRERVSSAVLAGDCEAAKRIALEGADVDLAVKAVAICTPKAAQ